jgi:hypothetical protein
MAVCKVDHQHNLAVIIDGADTEDRRKLMSVFRQKSNQRANGA